MKHLIERNAAILRHLHDDLQEAARHRSESAEAHARWQKACDEWHRRYDELAFPGGLKLGLQKIESGDPFAVETALCYLELRPFFFGAQYKRIAFTKCLKRLELRSDLKERLDTVVKRLP